MPDTPGAIALWLDQTLADSDAATLTGALGQVARKRGMAEIARHSGLSRESLYRALSPSGNPEFGTILKVLKALGLRLKLEAVE